MITISRDSGIVTVINVFSCEPSQQDALIKACKTRPQSSASSLALCRLLSTKVSMEPAS
jgi:hypothetical protein